MPFGSRAAAAARSLVSSSSEHVQEQLYQEEQHVDPCVKSTVSVFLFQGKTSTDVKQACLFFVQEQRIRVCVSPREKFSSAQGQCVGRGQCAFFVCCSRVV